MEIQYPDELLQSYFNLPIPECMIEFIIQKASSVIKCSPHPGNQSIQIMPSLPDFIRQLLLRVKVQSTVLVGAAVYLDRLKQKLPPGAKGMYCTTHRIFLASLIVASKYLCDTSLKNKHWAKYSSLSVQEINLMERQLLGLLVCTQPFR
ncbi:hypothetical protein BKA69DRAFT_531188 [Paraphysoderma sedebokerense]|nr:hypothetical protein BKA69DRAFT_531188 [Paraphysoderma sedebokerense]